MTKLRLLGAGLLCAIALTVGGIAVQGQTGGPPASKAAADPRDTDEAFIRRVSMDLRGVEPTPAEVHFFLANKDGTKRQTLVDLFVKEREQKRTTTERSLARARLVRDVREGETWSLLSAQRERLTVDALKQQIDATKATITATQNLFDELEAYQKRIGQATPEDAKLVARLRAELKAARDELARLMARYNEKEPPRPGPGSSRDADPEVRRVATRQFQIPVQVEPTRRGGVKELQLFVSADEGKTWRQAATLRPDGDAFRYEAPADGVYWFNVRVVASDGTADPRDVSIVLPTLKVEVRTAEVPNDPPTSEPQAGGPRPR